MKITVLNLDLVWKLNLLFVKSTIWKPLINTDFIVINNMHWEYRWIISLLAFYSIWCGLFWIVYKTLILNSVLPFLAIDFHCSIDIYFEKLCLAVLFYHITFTHLVFDLKKFNNAKFSLIVWENFKDLNFIQGFFIIAFVWVSQKIEKLITEVKIFNLG